MFTDQNNMFQKINPHDCTSIFPISLNYKIMYNLLQIF